jgi:WD40 repeat protein
MMFQPTLMYQLTFEGNWPSAVTFLGSWQQVAAGNQDGFIYAWELPETPPALNPTDSKGENKRLAPNVAPCKQFTGHLNAISQLLFDAKRQQLLSASFDHTIRFWPLAAASSGKANAILDNRARQAEFKRTKKPEVLAAPGVEVETYVAAKTLTAHEDWIHTLGADREFNRLISGDAAAQIIVWDVQQAQPISKWKGHAWNGIVAARLSTDGSTAAVAEFRYKRDDFDIPTAACKLWKVADGSEQLDFLKIQFPKLKAEDTTYGNGQIWKKFVADGFVALAFSPDDKLLAAGQGGETDTGKVHLLEVGTGKLVRDVSSHQYGITDACFSRDGKYLFTAGRDTCVRIVQVEDGKEIAVLGSPRGGQFKDWIASIALSPDETHLAAADISGHIAIWRLKN